MPIFIFGCDKCEHEQEVVHTHSTDKPPAKCEKCGEKGPKKRMGIVGHRFRASEGVGGWEMNQKGSLQRNIKGKNSTHYGM